MKTLLTTASVLIALAAAGPAGRGQASGSSQGQRAEGTTQLAQPAAATVFELKYRGLAAPDDPLGYHSY